MKKPSKNTISIIIKKGKADMIYAFFRGVKKGSYPTYDGKKMKKVGKASYYLEIKK